MDEPEFSPTFDDRLRALGGCCDNACLIRAPNVGTNGGKCYCSPEKKERALMMHVNERSAQAERVSFLVAFATTGRHE